MFWIVATSIMAMTQAQPDDNKYLLIQKIPSFAAGKSFDNVEECQKALMDGFLSADLTTFFDDDLGSPRFNLQRRGREVLVTRYDSSSAYIRIDEIACLKNEIVRESLTAEEMRELQQKALKRITED